MSLTFKASAYKVDTPELRDLAQVLHMQQRLRAAGSHSPKRLDSVTMQLKKEAVQERQERHQKEKELLEATLQELQKRTTARGGRQAKPVLKRPASATPDVHFRDELAPFKPTRRIRGKSSPALLAILQGPSNIPAKTRQAIVSRALAWQGIPQPGSPSTPQPGTPLGAMALSETAFASPGNPAPSTPSNDTSRMPCASPKPRVSPRATTPRAPTSQRYSPSRSLPSRLDASPRSRTPQRNSPTFIEKYESRGRSTQHGFEPYSSPTFSRTPQHGHEAAVSRSSHNPSPAASPRAATPSRPSKAPQQSWPYMSPTPKGAPRVFSPAPSLQLNSDFLTPVFPVDVD